MFLPLAPGAFDAVLAGVSDLNVRLMLNALEDASTRLPRERFYTIQARKGS